jgi:hypothetical protein
MARRLRLALYETCEWNPNGHVILNLKTTKMPRLATILITLIGSTSLCIAPLAFAQSDEDSTPSVSESDGIPGPPAPVAGDLAGPPTSATDGSSGTADDSSGAPASHTDWEQVPETNSDATSEGDGQVLEIPQSPDPARAAAPNRDDNSPAQASNEGQGDESGNDELGGLNDYQQGQNAELAGGYYISVPSSRTCRTGLCGRADGGICTVDGAWDRSRTDLAAISGWRVRAHTPNNLTARRARRNTFNQPDAHSASRIGCDAGRIVEQNALDACFPYYVLAVRHESVVSKRKL